MVEGCDHVLLRERARVRHGGGPEPQPTVEARARAAAGELRATGVERLVLREQLPAERIADGLVVVEAAVEPLDVSGRQHGEEVLLEVGADQEPISGSKSSAVEMLTTRRVP
jgi:hypothetical protein